jgi:predicted RNA-binding Zn ribbon-like protein
MTWNWTGKQFVAGALALDFANTVCYRDDPAREFDKLDEPGAFEGFVRAALTLSDARGWTTAGADGEQFALCAEIRDATDGLFRPVARGHAPKAGALAQILRLHRNLLGDVPLAVGEEGLELALGARPTFPLLLTQSALRLAFSPIVARLRLCPNCRWLFIDRSRNASRVWCDMLTCGNRAKSERHRRRIAVVAGNRQT